MWLSFYPFKTATTWRRKWISRYLSSSCTRFFVVVLSLQKNLNWISSTVCEPSFCRKECKKWSCARAQHHSRTINRNDYVEADECVVRWKRNETKTIIITTNRLGFVGVSVCSCVLLLVHKTKRQKKFPRHKNSYGRRSVQFVLSVHRVWMLFAERASFSFFLWTSAKKRNFFFEFIYFIFIFESIEFDVVYVIFATFFVTFLSLYLIWSELRFEWFVHSELNQIPRIHFQSNVKKYYQFNRKSKEREREKFVVEADCRPTKTVFSLFKCIKTNIKLHWRVFPFALFWYCTIDG